MNEKELAKGDHKILIINYNIHQKYSKLLNLILKEKTYFNKRWKDMIHIHTKKVMTVYNITLIAFQIYNMLPYHQNNLSHQLNYILYHQ